jgi:hypothetical protein
MARPEGSPDTIVQISEEGSTVIDGDGYPQGEISMKALEQQTHWELLRPPMRVKTGHDGSHAFLTHEFIRAIVEDRWPAINIYEAIALHASRNRCPPISLE